MPRDNAPIGHTCPNIDEAQNLAESIREGLLNSSNQLKKWIDKLESLRKSNTELREWGNQQYERAEAAEYDLENAKGTIEDLQQELKELLKEIDKCSSNHK